MILITLAERFYRRFSGLERAHGRYLPSGHASGNGKQQGSATTVREPVTVEHWAGHLEGTYGVGIVPIKDDGTAVFGAIDVDEYHGDLNMLSEQVAQLELPLILCRSKSGGAHLFLFAREPIPAELMRGKLMEWAVSLGYSGVEVFPKQTRLAGLNDYGNWINMPYFKSEDTLRYAIFAGRKLSAEEFMDIADMIAVDEATLRATSAPESDEFKEALTDAPPCLQCLALKGFGEGSRNNALFNIGVYLRKRYGDDFWEQYLDEYNQKFMNPPLGHKEVNMVARSVKRKAYEYRCNDQPIVSVCNRQICLTRKHGIGGGADDPGVVFGTLVKLSTDPPTWIWDVDGARIELTTMELKDQNRFHSRCIDVLNKWPLLMKPNAWAKLVREKLQAIEVVDVPQDATPEGQMWAYLETYCTGRQQARSKEELLQNKPWTDKAEKRTFFVASHFKQYLEQHRVRVSERTLWAWLRKRNAGHQFFNLKGRGVNTWHVPAFQVQTEDFAIPTLDDEAM